MAKTTDGQFVKVPVPGDLQRGQNIKLPVRPQPAPAQTQSGGKSNGSK